MAIHINRPSSTVYQARVRREGAHKYKLVGPRTPNYRRALLAMAREFATGQYKRGDVLMGADYYDPTLICEIVRA